ncbi:MAG: hypothetical protein OEY06_01760 [Gammaproteobacteria bacterium]|nr:hypothetical protein [Gammaproteobacteria bacterium]
MSDESQPYVRSLADELDWTLLDQLHSAVTQISGFCFEIKKFCVTTTFVVLALLIKFTSDKLDSSLFVAGALIPLCFWFLDSVAYYYQVKLRGTMEVIRYNIKERGSVNAESSNLERTISNSRVNKSLLLKIKDAFINNSMWLYLFMVVIDIIAWNLYKSGAIS